MKQKKRNLFRISCTLLCCLLSLAACGGNEEDVQPSPSGTEEPSSIPDGEETDAAVYDGDFYDVASGLQGGKFLGMQFWQGEPVQLWMSEPVKDDGGSFVSVYMYRKDGTREVCLERIDEPVARRIYVRDAEGCFYTVSGEIGSKKVSRLDSVGKAQYTVPLAGNMWGIRTLADGRVALLTAKESSTAGGYNLLLLDSKGKLSTVFESEKLNQPVLGTSEEGLLLLEGDYVYRVSLSDGKREQVYSFRQTDYVVKKEFGVFSDIQDFRMDPDGGFVFLRADQKGAGKCETVKSAAKVQGCKEVVLRTAGYMNQEFWFKERIQEFNNSQDEYRIVIEACEDGEDRNAFLTATGVELAAGKGPELLMGGIPAEMICGLIEKGMLMDLVPLMGQSGIREEDYFPAAFDMWRAGDCIYGINCNMAIYERLMSTAVLGDMREPSVEALADALLAYPEQAVYSTSSATGILIELLEGSETLWGMVDWEKGTCDFSGELFGKLLEVAKRYQYDERNNYPKVTTQHSLFGMYSIYFDFYTEAEKEANGYVPTGVLFDDGRYPVPTVMQSGNRVLMLNANAANRDGAWEFVKFLLSDESQEKLAGTFDPLPVKKSVFKSLLEKEIADGPAENLGKETMVFEPPLTRERADEIEAFLESARALPYKTAPILEIIREESVEYFNGNKSIGQVAAVIENRVQLYLDEQRK